ncbi:MAG: hypothetical protein HC851_04160 [Acaryochloris sp. RU_4_1]|nr:hypothetical protein [Acaryochloris sp. RU_4_1]NJR55136.1 hypothetical protein [Acaryochloris sp. CRU_2_0]
MSLNSFGGLVRAKAFAFNTGIAGILDRLRVDDDQRGSLPFFSRAAKLTGVISAPVEPSKSEENDGIAAVAPVSVDAVGV